MEQYSNVGASDFPRQNIPFAKKGKAWRRRNVDWAANKSYNSYSPVRNSVAHKKIAYDLLNGIVHEEDMEIVLNPEQLKSNYKTQKVQHYPIINSKLNVLRGEESKRLSDFRVIITNPSSLSSIEENKKKELMAMLQENIEDLNLSEEELAEKTEELNKYYNYTWKDLREIRANQLTRHYIKELDMPVLFNAGFMDALTVGEEIYLCDIVSGEPAVERINPMKIRIFRSGFSNKIEDADMVVLEDYWSPGKIIETYYESLTKRDIEYIENLPSSMGSTDDLYNADATEEFIPSSFLTSTGEGFYFSGIENANGYSNLSPYDMAGNVRVMRVFWKSKRKIKKIKSYDELTGEEFFEFYPETYEVNKDLGEEETELYINEAWEGTLIGKEIYVNMRPRPIQYNRLSNPSRCHFGIIGTIYNLNDTKPFSLVDIAKPFSYLYDAIHDRLIKALAKSWGKLIKLDFAKVPRGWSIDKWLYYAKTSGIMVEDSFKEGDKGSATGKLAGGLNNASSGIVDAEMGNYIQSLVNLLEYIKAEMSEVMGISKQREGQISNRETVGGVERATLQSSHITEWLYTLHENTKKRVIECILETAKIALKGRSKKFSYITSNNLLKIMEIDGDEFAESDYGLLVENSSEVQALKQNLNSLAQAAIQNNKMNFSTYMKLFTSASMAEKQRMIEQSEEKVEQQQQQQQQQEMQMRQNELEQQAKLEQARMDREDLRNKEANETKILAAQIQAQSKIAVEAVSQDNAPEEDTEFQNKELAEKVRQFNARLALDKKKHEDDVTIKNKQLAKNTGR